MGLLQHFQEAFKLKHDKQQVYVNDF